MSELVIADATARYASAGWPVHPVHDTTAGRCSCRHGSDCRQPGKHPRTAEGFHDATTTPPRSRGGGDVGRTRTSASPRDQAPGWP
jgi:hypothetical protein